MKGVADLFKQLLGDSSSGDEDVEPTRPVAKTKKAGKLPASKSFADGLLKLIERA